MTQRKKIEIEIEANGTMKIDRLILEVLLDIRELLAKNKND